MAVTTAERPAVSPASPASLASPAAAAALPVGRVMVVWCPDWPVLAAAAQDHLPAETPIAVVTKGEVMSCSPSARREGVRRGMRRREASGHCPDLVVVEGSDERDNRYFDAVLTAIEEVSAAVSPLRPGLCALAVPHRFYGGEHEAAAVVTERLVGAGVWDCRTGVADGLFAAEQAARLAGPQECRIVPPGGSAAFLSELPISVLDDPDLVSLLRRLGIRGLGDFAALSAKDVLTRFGRPGAWLHRLARGQDARVAARRQPPLDATQEVHFEPPLDTIEPIVFSSRRTAERCVAELARHGLVCTRVTVEVVGDRGWTGSRSWAHSRWFAAADLVDRLYWQLQGSPAPEPVSTVRLLPEVVESLGDQGEGLWGSAPDERVERGVARLQGMLGPEAVQSPHVHGGRGVRERQISAPWGERAEVTRPAGLPWPGSIPPPAPTRVFATPRPAQVMGPDGQPVGVTARGLITADPHRFRPEPGSRALAVAAWAGPWPIEELWWDPVAARRVARFQVVGVDGSAWLMVVENGQWWTEARYD